VPLPHHSGIKEYINVSKHEIKLSLNTNDQSSVRQITKIVNEVLNHSSTYKMDELYSLKTRLSTLKMNVNLKSKKSTLRKIIFILKGGRFFVSRLNKQIIQLNKQILTLNNRFLDKQKTAGYVVASQEEAKDKISHVGDYKLLIQSPSVIQFIQKLPNGRMHSEPIQSDEDIEGKIVYLRSREGQLKVLEKNIVKDLLIARERLKIQSIGSYKIWKDGNEGKIGFLQKIPLNGLFHTTFRTIENDENLFQKIADILSKEGQLNTLNELKLVVSNQEEAINILNLTSSIPYLICINHENSKDIEFFQRLSNSKIHQCLIKEDEDLFQKIASFKSEKGQLKALKEVAETDKKEEMTVADQTEALKIEPIASNPTPINNQSEDLHQPLNNQLLTNKQLPTKPVLLKDILEKKERELTSREEQLKILSDLKILVGKRQEVEETLKLAPVGSYKVWPSEKLLGIIHFFYKTDLYKELKYRKIKKNENLFQKMAEFIDELSLPS